MNNPYDQNILNVNMQNNYNPGGYQNPNSATNFADGNQSPTNPKKKKKRKPSNWNSLMEML
jgi:hypothetical protein